MHPYQAAEVEYQRRCGAVDEEAEACLARIRATPFDDDMWPQQQPGPDGLQRQRPELLARGGRDFAAARTGYQASDFAHLPPSSPGGGTPKRSTASPQFPRTHSAVSWAVEGDGGGNGGVANGGSRGRSQPPMPLTLPASPTGPSSPQWEQVRSNHQSTTSIVRLGDRETG